MLTAPSKDTFDPLDNYDRVRFIGDRDLSDEELNQVQQIGDEKRKRLFDRVFVEGSVIAEAGGTVSPTTRGVFTGNVTGTSSGTYNGFITQIYTLVVQTGGGAGAAVIHVSSDGDDNGSEQKGYDIAILPTDPLNGTIAYDVGMQGVKVAFTDNKVNKNFVQADSWTILATYSRRLPTPISGTEIQLPTATVYVDGRVVFVPANTLVYAAATTGKSVVYIEVLRTITTSDADPDLLQASTGAIGAEREKLTATFADHDMSAEALPANGIWRKVFPAYLWDRATNQVQRSSPRSLAFNLGDIPGQLPAASLADLDFSEGLKGILAEIVQDITGGSYRISGLIARLSTNIAPAGKFFVTVEAGKARISGLRIATAVERDVQFDLATDAKVVTGEAKQFTTGTNVYALNKAIGGDKLPITAVTSLTATVQVVRSITKGAANGLDALPDQPVSSIISVVQGGTTYVPTTSYLLNGNFVDWSPGGAEPTSGTSYTVTYRYTKQMINPTDFILVDSDGDGDLDSVDFSPAGDNPVNATTFFATYTYYLPRIDRIILRTDAVFQVLRGVPEDHPVPPPTPSEFLAIATVIIGANSATNISVVQEDNIRVTMAQSRDAIRRQEDQRRNDALQSLLNQTQFRETASFKGVFADAFATEEMSDLTFLRPAGVGGVGAGLSIQAHSALDLVNFEAFNAASQLGTHALTRNDALVLPSQVASIARRDFLVLPYTEILEIDQAQWSEQRNVNPFAVFTSPPPTASLTPDRDGGVNITTSTFNDVWVSWVVAPAAFIQTDIQTIRAGTLGGRLVEQTPPITEYLRLMQERGGTYMRQVLVTVSGQRFVPGEDNIAALFDGKPVNLAPINGTLPGTIPGTVKARASTFAGSELLTLGGDWEATFVIPDNVPTGLRSLALNGASGSQTAAPYDGNFTQREISIFNRQTFEIYDPLAQTFASSQPLCITRVEIPFATKAPNSGVPVSLQLRSVELPGGFPGLAIFDELVKKAEDIQVGETSINNFIFANPLYIPANTYRAIVLLTSSNEYSVYSATLGRGGQNPIAYITSNPNIRGLEPAGILLESLNALNWEAASRTALRHRIYRAQFSPESWTYFDRVPGLYSQLLLVADQVVPVGTQIIWQVSTDGLAVDNSQKTWRGIQPYFKLDLGQVASNIDLRVRLLSENPRITPYINFNNLALQGLGFAAGARYVSKASDVLQDIATVHLYVEVNKPGAATIVYFATNGEDTSQNPVWEIISTVTSDVDLGDGFHDVAMTLNFNNAIVQKTSKRRLRLRLDWSEATQPIQPVRFRKLAATFI